MIRLPAVSGHATIKGAAMQTPSTVMRKMPGYLRSVSKAAYDAGNMNVFSGLTEYSAEARQAAAEINALAAAGRPFLFLFDFELERPRVIPLEEAASLGIWYDFAGKTNAPVLSAPDSRLLELRVCEDLRGELQYRRAFDCVRMHLLRGDIYLTNLTHRVPIQATESLEEIFAGTRAHCRVLVKDECVVFSPETFVTIRDGIIATYPMKGTRLIQDRESADLLLNDAKEIAEHATVVDLLRNDLSMVAEQVSVKRYRYLEQIETAHGTLLQTCSEITGVLPENYRQSIGDIILTLLPAGSVSGAPKSQAVKIAGLVENPPRGYYTGVFGIWDGKSLESAVMIRFIEKQGEQMFFRSGGGITVNSQLETEYREILEKIVLPKGVSHDL